MVPEKIIEGKNVEEAVKIASDTFNVPVEKLKYEVITYGSSGIFGLVGVKKAKIRVTIPEEKAVKRDEEKEVNSVANKAPKKYHEKKTGTKGKSKAPIEKSIPVAIEGEAQPDSIEISESTLQGDEKKENFSENAENASTTLLPDELKAFADNPVALGKAVLLRILETITIETNIEVEVEKDEDQIIFNVKGGKAAVLIGKRGQTLEAIQYLIEKIVNRTSEKRIRLQIDVQGYLKNRRENLEQLATRLAEKAQRIGKPVTVGEMNVHDRKIVHMALKDHRHVRTQSMGSGFYRKLMIFPKKNGMKKEGPRKEIPTDEVEENG